MLSVLFATEACYTIKQNNNNNNNNNNNKKSFCRGKLPFCRQKLNKAYFALAFAEVKNSEFQGLRKNECFSFSCLSVPI